VRELQVEQFGGSCATPLKGHKNTPISVLRSASHESMMVLQTVIAVVYVA